MHVLPVQEDARHADAEQDGTEGEEMSQRQHRSALLARRG